MALSTAVATKSTRPELCIAGFVRLPMPVVLSRIASAIQYLRREANDPLIVFIIDGKPSSGKSTFARSLAGKLSDCTVLEADAFLMPRAWRDSRMRQLSEGQNDMDGLVVQPDFHSSFWDWERLHDCILDAHHAAENLSRGNVTSKVISSTYNRATGNCDACERLDIRRGGVLLIPGCYLLEHMPPSVFQSSMIMTVASDEGLRRKLMREDSKPDLPDASRFGSVGWSWINIEEPTFEHHLLKSSHNADAIIDNSNWARPCIRKFEFGTSARELNLG